MAKNKLEIFVTLVTAQAEKADQQFHAAAKQRIKATADAHDKAEKSKVDSAKANAEKIKKINAEVDRDLQTRAKSRARYLNEACQAESKAAKAAADTAKRYAAIAADGEKQLAAARDKIFQNRLDQFRRESRAGDVLHKEQMARSAAHRAQVTQEQSQLRTSFTLWERLTGTIKNTKKATEDATGSANKHESSVTGIAKAYTQLRVAAEVGQYINAAMQTMARSSSEARDYIIRIVQEMERAREISKELANLEGKPATGAYTADQARQASAVGATPEEFVAGKKGYQEFGAQYVGKEGATKDERAEEVKDKKVAYEVSQETQRRAMKMFGAMGLDPTQGMKLMATVTGKMSKENPNVTADEIILQTRKLAEAARTATGATGVGIEQLQGSIQESVGESGDLKSMEEAAVIMRTMQEVDPNEGKMLSRNLLRGLHDIRQNKKGEADELGITKDMDTMQQLAQAAKRIPEIAAETGETEADVEQRLFKDSREYRAAKAVFNQGMTGGGFARTRKAMDSITKESETKEESDYMQSEIGSQKSQDSMTASAERERAARMNPLQGYKREAKRALAASGELEKPENILGAAATMGGQALGQGDRAAQEERALQVAELKRRLKGTPGGRKWLRAHPGMSSTDGAIAALSWGLIKPSGRYADESWMGEAALEIERQRSSPSPMQQANPAVPGASASPGGPAAFEQNTTTDAQRMHEEQQRNRETAAAQAAAAKDIAKSAEQMKHATKFGVPAALPSRPHVQRH